MNPSVGIITVSDRAAVGVYADLGGPALTAACKEYGWPVIADVLVPDEKDAIVCALESLEAQGCHLILTTGGTGVALRDITPESIRSIMRVELPGFGEIMRAESMKITPNAILSRSMAAIVGKSLVVALPGKPSGAVECLGFIHAAIPHAVEVAAQIPTSC